MRILSRYVFARFLTWFALTFALFCGVTASADLLMEFERVRELGGEGVQPVVYLLMRLPALHFEFLIPISAFAAALIVTACTLVAPDHRRIVAWTVFALGALVAAYLALMTMAIWEFLAAVSAGSLSAWLLTRTADKA